MSDIVEKKKRGRRRKDEIPLDTLTTTIELKKREMNVTTTERKKLGANLRSIGWGPR